MQNYIYWKFIREFIREIYGEQLKINQLSVLCNVLNFLLILALSSLRRVSIFSRIINNSCNRSNSNSKSSKTRRVDIENRDPDFELLSLLFLLKRHLPFSLYEIRVISLSSWLIGLALRPRGVTPFLWTRKSTEIHSRYYGPCDIWTP